MMGITIYRVCDDLAGTGDRYFATEAEAHAFARNNSTPNGDDGPTRIEKGTSDSRLNKQLLIKALSEGAGFEWEVIWECTPDPEQQPVYGWRDVKARAAAKPDTTPITDRITRPMWLAPIGEPIEIGITDMDGNICEWHTITVASRDGRVVTDTEGTMWAAKGWRPCEARP